MSQQDEQQSTEKDKQDKKTDESTADDKQDGKESETPRDGRKQQKEYFKEELRRLKSSLNKESSKIKRPPKKKHTPDTFNTLQPYYNTQTAAFLIGLERSPAAVDAIIENDSGENDDCSNAAPSDHDMKPPTTKPDEVRHNYLSRSTALGLTDPWVDHNMDVTVLPKIDNRPAAKQDPDSNKKKKPSNKDRPPKSGSTRLPKFPAVEVPAGELSSRTLYYSDVPMLRDELRKKYTDKSDAKVQAEYSRTKKDFYRMELDRMDQFHPSNRKHMRACYFAYLQNNKGSKKAIHECVKTVEKEQQEEENEPEKAQSERAQNDDEASVRSGRQQQQQQQQQPVEASA